MVLIRKDELTVNSLAVLVPFHTTLFALVRTSWNEPKCSHVTTSTSLFGKMCLWTHSLNCFSIGQKARAGKFQRCFRKYTKTGVKCSRQHTAIVERQLHGLIRSLVILYYIVCIYHFRQYIHFENEAQMRLENNVLMHCKQQRHVTKFLWGSAPPHSPKFVRDLPC